MSMRNETSNTRPSYIGRTVAHRGHSFTVTSRTTPEGWRTYGFIVNDGPHANRRQSPCWYLQREAIASAHFHLDQWDREP